MNTSEDQLRKLDALYSGNVGIVLWVHTSGNILGCLLGSHMEPISGTTLWEPVATVEEAITALVRLAEARKAGM